MSLTPSQLAAQVETQPPQPHAFAPPIPAVVPAAASAPPRARTKRCPSCGLASSADAFFCAQCGADISLERSAPQPASAIATAAPGEEAPEGGEGDESGAAPMPGLAAAPVPTMGGAPALRPGNACPQCSHGNPAFAILCMACGADLMAAAVVPNPAGGAAGTGAAPSASAPNSAAPRAASGPPPVRDRTTPAPPPVPGSLARAAAAESAPPPRLQLLIGNKTFDCNDGDILGRAGTLASDLFAPFGTVSRQHASIVMQHGRWFIVPSPSVHNATRLDGQELRRGEPAPLTGEHTLGMSTKCEVKLRVVPA